MQSSSLVWCHKLPDHWSVGVWDSRRTSSSHSSSLGSAAKSGNAWNTLSSPQPLQHGLLLRYNTDSYLHVKWREPGGMHYAPRCFSILAYVRFYIVWMLFRPAGKWFKNQFVIASLFFFFIVLSSGWFLQSAWATVLEWNLMPPGHQVEWWWYLL